MPTTTPVHVPAAKPVQSFVGYVVTRASVDPGFRAAIARALDPVGTGRAVPLLAKPLDAVPDQYQEGLVLAAAILCRRRRQFPVDAAGSPRRRFADAAGRCLADRQSVSARVIALESLPVAAAARVIDSLIGQLANERPGVRLDAIDLAWMLARWADPKVRRAVNWDFHSA